MSLPTPWGILFGSQQLEIPLLGSTPDAIARLRSIVHPTFLHLQGAPGLVGKVSEERVSVRYQRRWYPGNQAPVFVGHFAIVGGRQSLVGAVRLNRFTQVWWGAAFGFLLLCTVIVVPAMLLGLTEPGAGWGLLVLGFLWAAMLGELYFYWWRRKQDRADIRRRLREALSPVAA